MKQIYTAKPGTSLNSISLYNATPIKGIEIDNPTGGWLYIASETAYVPPYTMGWAMPLTYSQSSISITYGTGPTGLQGTLVGDNWAITLYDEVVAQSGGQVYQFSDKGFGLSYINLNIRAQLVTTAYNSPNFILGRNNTMWRWRVIAITISLASPSQGYNLTNYPENTVFVGLEAMGGAGLSAGLMAAFRLTETNPTFTYQSPAGYTDLDGGIGINMPTQTSWGANRIDVGGIVLTI